MQNVGQCATNEWNELSLTFCGSYLVVEITLVIVVATALLFDFTNGFHDTANAIATVVATKAIKPKTAVIFAAVLNFLGALVSTSVAATVATGIVSTGAITLEVVLAGLVGAVIWNLITWRFGIPSSSSHALVGGVAGSAVALAGTDVVKWSGLIDKVAIPSLIAPVIGIVGAGLLMLLIARLIRNKPEDKTNKYFKRLQILSGGFVAFTHGTNDSQKTMGVIALALLIVYPQEAFSIPLWVIISAGLAMAAGTYIGGWRIIHTLGHKITKLESPQGFAAEAATATTLGLTAHFGFPVSTTHTITGAILGAGAVTQPSLVNWRILKRILIAWLITIPCAGAMGAVAELLTCLPFGTGLVVLVAGLSISAIVFTRHWTRESIAQVVDLLSVLRRIRSSKKNVSSK